ncbi:MAG TPA: TonB-dependent receptor [Steroidobacteraceae bacterium]|nr:TonB-dependent receptor [Steroidobacteraceae bacterium]
MSGTPEFSFAKSWRCALRAPLVVALAMASVTQRASADDTRPLEEIVVTASLRPEAASELPASVTVLGTEEVATAGLQHLADLVGFVPNLNWSGATSRPRYYQLRGVGELEQYQGAPNPSVGFLIDDIDFSGVGMPATTYDVQQVEVLRGPQGTHYGANALAGLISVRTMEPAVAPELSVEATAGGDGLLGAGAVAGGALGDWGAAHDSAWRLVAQRTVSDGFRHNAYLGVDDTNDRDETTLRGKVRIEPAAGWRVDAAAMYVDIHNGFDAFSLDNGFRTLSNQPGRDEQRSQGGMVRVTGDLGRATLTSTTSYADSDILYSFDGDWANDPYWGIYAPYDYFSRYARQRSTLAEDLRLTSNATARSAGFGWLMGLYALRLEEDNQQRDFFESELVNPPLVSAYHATNAAAYGETDWRIAGSTVLSAGLRVETRSASYHDSNDERFSPVNTMVGGHLSLSGDLGADSTWYATVARGYKAGGFNIGLYIPPSLREFGPEYLWNAEAGMHLRDASGTLSADVDAFYMWRVDEQVSASYQVDPGDPLSYVFYTSNAANGRNYGVEGSVAWRARPQWLFTATLGLLGSEYLNYHYGDRNLDGREQAAAPPYQYSVSAQWGLERGWMARADVSGCASYYFDTSNDQKSNAYMLVNLKAGYVSDHWSVSAWVRNAFDEAYALRGFYFQLEPPDYPYKLYIQRGDPQLAGVTVTWSLK